MKSTWKIRTAVFELFFLKSGWFYSWFSVPVARLGTLMKVKWLHYCFDSKTQETLRFRITRNRNIILFQILAFRVLFLSFPFHSFQFPPEFLYSEIFHYSFWPASKCFTFTSYAQMSKLTQFVPNILEKAPAKFK